MESDYSLPDHTLPGDFDAFTLRVLEDSGGGTQPSPSVGCLHWWL